jgi:hypothetical protein
MDSSGVMPFVSSLAAYHPHTGDVRPADRGQRRRAGAHEVLDDDGGIRVHRITEGEPLPFAARVEPPRADRIIHCKRSTSPCHRIVAAICVVHVRVRDVQSF